MPAVLADSARNRRRLQTKSRIIFLRHDGLDSTFCGRHKMVWAQAPIASFRGALGPAPRDECGYQAASDSYSVRSSRYPSAFYGREAVCGHS